MLIVWIFGFIYFIREVLFLCVFKVFFVCIMFFSWCFLFMVSNIFIFFWCICFKVIVGLLILMLVVKVGIIIFWVVKIFEWFIFFMKVCIYLLVGLVKIFFLVLICIIWLFFIKVIWLLICKVLFKLCVIKIMVFLIFFCKFNSLFCILWWINGLRVENVLFINKIFGLLVKVWVRLICCCILLDNWFGNWFLKVIKLEFFKVFLVFVWCFFLGILWIFKLYFVFFKIVWWGKRLKFWKIMFILFWCILCNFFLFKEEIFCLLI